MPDKVTHLQLPTYAPSAVAKRLEVPAEWLRLMRWNKSAKHGRKGADRK